MYVYVYIYSIAGEAIRICRHVMYVCVCIYVRIYACVYACMHVCIYAYVCVHVCMCGRMYLSTHGCLCVRVRVCTHKMHLHVYIHAAYSSFSATNKAFLHARMHPHIHACTSLQCTQTYTKHTCPHTDTHTAHTNQYIPLRRPR
jgi:hypothetical protein